MELVNNQEEQNAVGIGSISRVLAREASIGQSSRVYYRASEGVPFRWEMQPGTPKHPQGEDIIPPLSPPPSIQGLGLTLPNVDDDDDDDEGSSKASRIRSLRKMVKKRMNLDHISKKVEILVKRSSKEREGSRVGDSSNGEFVSSVKGSSFSSCSLSSSVSFSSEVHVVESSRLQRVSTDGPFCCSPWDVQIILDEGNTKIYYCRHHRTAFAVEEDDSFLSRILSRVSTADQFSGPLNNDVTPGGVPFRWEMQPGTPKNLPETELIPPPSPPPAVQGRDLPLPHMHDHDEETAEDSKWIKVWSKVKNGYKKKQNGKIKKEISFRYRDDNEAIKASIREPVSVSPLSKGGWRVSRIKRSLPGGYFSRGHWSRKDVIAFVRTKFKAFKS